MASGKWNVTYRYKSKHDSFTCLDCNRKNYSMGNFTPEILDVAAKAPSQFRRYIQARFEGAAKKSCLAVQALLQEFKQFEDETTFDAKTIRTVCDKCHGLGFLA